MRVFGDVVLEKAGSFGFGGERKCISFHHIDSEYGKPWEEFIEGDVFCSDDTLDEMLKRIKKAFFDAGWEGDGEICVYRIPPFCIPNSDTHGIDVFHVKQSNNGTSFLLVPDDWEVCPQ